MKIAVAGATGQVGAPLVDAVRATGHEAVPIARSLGIDLTRPSSALASLLEGVDAVVDVTQTREREVGPAAEFFTSVARNLGQAARTAGVTRTVLLSIIGVDRIAAAEADPGGRDAHYRAKNVHEQATLEHAPGPHVVRAAQFHDLARVLLEAARQGDVSYVADMPVQPVDVPEVVRVLLAVAVGDLDDPVVEVAGPRVERFCDLAVAFAARDHDGLGWSRSPSARLSPAGRCCRDRTRSSPGRRSRSGSAPGDGEEGQMTDAGAEDGEPRLRRLVAARPELLPAAAVGLLLLLTSGRYGYHRDELYFLEAGHHLAWGYPDQPPLVPVLARLMSALVPDSLVALRLPSTLSAATVVALSGALAGRLGAGRGGRLLAAGATAISGFVLGTGHLLSTSTLDVLGWTLLTYLLLRLVRGGDARLWLLAGLVGGVTMQANVLVGFLLAGFAAAVVLVGPRDLLRSPWPWLAAGIALLVGLPYLVWQAQHGWPQLDVAHNIAAGGSGSSASRASFVPLLLLEVGPWLVPLWVGGLLRLGRDRALRCFAATFVLLLVVFVATGGKPYYLAGLFPVLFAAGAQPFLDRVRRPWVAPAILLLSTPAIVFTLPLLPVSAVDPVVAVNYDAGETIGWPEVTRQVAAAYDALPAGTAIVTSNYGQAGAIDRYGPALGLPSAYSGHNAYAAWGHPPGAAPALLVGIDATLRTQSCTQQRTLGRLRSPSNVDNDENGTVLTWCVPARPWRELWPAFTHLG